MKIYCIVPRELAAKLHEPLRRHYLGDPGVEVVVERRRGDRRRTGERRETPATADVEQRRIRNPDGRRIAETRASVEVVQAAPLPRRARSYADRLRFVQRLEPASRDAEDVDSARVVTRFQAGDRNAFVVLYMRYFDRVFSYLRLVLDDPHAAEDATQQALMKIFEALPRYERRPGATFRAWLFAIVRNEALRELGKRKRVEIVDPADLGRRRDELEPSAERDLTALDWVTDRELLLLIERLPPVQQQVLMLRFMLDLPSKEIAAILGVSVSNVRILQHRGLRFLEQRMTALGRHPRGGRRADMGRPTRQVFVLRARRFALSP